MRQKNDKEALIWNFISENLMDCEIKEDIIIEEKCPLCENGRRTYGKSSLNGHRHTFCSTEGCLMYFE